MKLTAAERLIVQKGLPHLEALMAFMSQGLKIKSKELSQVERLVELLKTAGNEEIRR